MLRWVRRRRKTREEAWRRRLLEGAIPPAESLAFAEFALGKVSRTFALNIRVLPRALREQVLYAYLYCRMADTLEDEAGMPQGEKARLLRAFAALFDPERDAAQAEAAMGAFPEQLPPAWKSSRSWEHLLLGHAPVLLRPFLEFPEPVRKVIARCVGEMCVGMAGFAEKAGAQNGPNLVDTLEELDNYCYYVAGTVGVLLCDLFVRHSAAIRTERARSLKALCVSFGQGLQLTNILKDLQDDRKRNVSWLPGELLQAEHITFQDFLRPERRAEAKRVYKVLLGKAKKHLEDALEYSCLIPRWERRLRLFCLWPLFMAAETLALLAESSESLTEGVRLKISRNQVRNIVRRTTLFCWSNRWIRTEFRKPIRRLEAALR